MTLESDAPTALSARLAFIAERLRIHGAARFSGALTRLAAEAASLEARLARAEHRLDAIVGIAYDLETDDAPNVIPFPKEAAKKKLST